MSRYAEAHINEQRGEFMSRWKVGGTRNFGYGRNAWQAAKRKMLEAFGGGRHSTLNTLLDRFVVIERFYRAHGVRDLREVSVEIARAFADFCKSMREEDEWLVAYSQNLISAQNVVLSLFYPDRRFWI